MTPMRFFVDTHDRSLGTFPEKMSTEERHRKSNPPLPEWLRDDYRVAWRKLEQLALSALQKPTDSETLQSSLAVIAIARGNLKLGALIIDLDSSELDEILEQQLAWNELYDETGHF